MSARYQFPTLAEMQPDFANQKWDKKLRLWFRYQFSRFYNRKECEQFCDFLTEKSFWQPIFLQKPYRVDALLNKYCDNRLNASERLAAIKQHFAMANQKVSEQLWQQLFEQKTLVLAVLTDELTLNLNINQIDPFEGFFSINIQNQAKQALYDASFTFLAEGGLLIASIQGPKGEQAQEQVKWLTKQLHGMRPMFMLVNAFKVISRQLNCELYGIPHKAQAKYRWNDSSRLLFNYDEFWQENEGKQQGNYWHLPLELERRPLEEIQSKKRSMYRKRYEMFDLLEQSVAAFFASGQILE